MPPPPLKNRSRPRALSRVRELEPVAAGEFTVLLKTGAHFHMTCSLGELQARMGKI